jgi:hypothetical protein
MRLYICGPMTGKPGNNFDSFFLAEKILSGLGYQVVNPARISLASGIDKTWEAYMRADIPEMLACDGLAILPESEESRGARFEMFVAGTLGLEIKSVQMWMASAKVSHE